MGSMRRRFITGLQCEHRCVWKKNSGGYDQVCREGAGWLLRLKITYVQRGTASTRARPWRRGRQSRRSRAFAANLGVFTGHPGLTGVADLTSLPRVRSRYRSRRPVRGPTGATPINGAHVVVALAPLPPSSIPHDRNPRTPSGARQAIYNSHCTICNLHSAICNEDRQYR